MSVTWRSSRGGPETGFEEALLRGLAPDGGLYLPVRFPRLPADWADAPDFTSLAATVLQAWLGEDERLQEICREAFDFPVPLVTLPSGVSVLELFHGPTLAFKDFGARFMARVMNDTLSRTGQRRTVLVATSGDTGSAVADGFAGLQHLDVILLYPAGRVSPLQELQLTVERPGVTSLRVDGTFDDCQRLVKAALSDGTLAGRDLTSANSINIGRLLPQQLYYLEALRHLGDRPLMIVPSGNLGNLTAGTWARETVDADFGLVAAHNANDFYPRYLRNEAEAYDFPPTVMTHSNAMDVGAPSNFERLDADGFSPADAAVSVSDAETLERIRTTFSEDGYLACPHTAVGLEAAAGLSASGRQVVVLATAHPAKFPEVVSQALPGAMPRAQALDDLLDRPVSVRDIGSDYAGFRELLLS